MNGGVFLLLFSHFYFLVGRWPRLNSEKRLWVAHPYEFVSCKGGVFRTHEWFTSRKESEESPASRGLLDPFERETERALSHPE